MVRPCEALGPAAPGPVVVVILGLAGPRRTRPPPARVLDDLPHAARSASRAGATSVGVVRRQINRLPKSLSSCWCHIRGERICGSDFALGLGRCCSWRCRLAARAVALSAKPFRTAGFNERTDRRADHWANRPVGARGAARRADAASRRKLLADGKGSTFRIQKTL